MPDRISYIKNSSGDVNAAVVDEVGYAETLLKSVVQVAEVDINPKSGMTTNIVLVAGVPTIIAIPEISSFARIDAFVVGDTTTSAVFASNSRAKLTPQISGSLRLYNTGTDTNHVKVLVYTDEQHKVEKNYSKVLPRITTRAVMDSAVVHKGKNFAGNIGVSVDNFVDKLIDSNVATISEPVLIRDQNGFLLYDLQCTGESLVNNAKILHLFDANGVYLKSYDKQSINSELFKTNKDAYYAAFVEYSNFPDSKWIALNVIDREVVVDTYRVGKEGDWDTFTGMLVGLKENSKEKIVIVEGGIYDIYEEMGGNNLIASIHDPSSLNWRDVCHIVPDNTTIIGEGHVILRWMPPADIIGSNDMAFLFSPLNVSGTCHIENIDIECQNCRYGIHDETSSQSQWDGAVHVFKNVRVKNHGGLYGTGRAYCAGHNRNMMLEFIDCEFDSSNSAVNAWSTHMDNQDQYGMSTFNFLGCKFFIKSGGEAVRFSSLAKIPDYCTDEVKFNSCYIAGGKIRFSDENYGSYNPQHDSGYRVQLIGCNPANALYDSNINEGVFEQYNTIGGQQ